MNFNARLKELRSQPETSRAGMKWTEDEDRELLEQISKGDDFEDIAKIHQRTLIAIKSRICLHALSEMQKKNLSLHNTAERFRISIEELDLYQKRQEKKKISKPIPERGIPPSSSQFIPDIYRGMEERLEPWQKIVWDAKFRPFQKEINILFHPQEGREDIGILVELHNRGIFISAKSTVKKTIASVYHALSRTNNRKPELIVFHLCEAIRKSKVSTFLNAIYLLKKGYVEDDTTFTKWYFNPPEIWIIAGILPNFIEKRGIGENKKVWTIDKNKELEEYIANG